jgi:hypothetical protein
MFHPPVQARARIQLNAHRFEIRLNKVCYLFKVSDVVLLAAGHVFNLATRDEYHLAHRGDLEPLNGLL